MAFGMYPVTTTQTALPSGQIPIGSVAVPGHANGDLTALEGGPENSDSNQNKTAPVSTYSYDGRDETIGAKATPAVTDSTQVAPAMSFWKGAVKVLADVWDSVNHRMNTKDSNSDAIVTLLTNPANPTYEFNAGGPVLASGVLSGLNTDRRKNMQGKGWETGTITSPSAGATSLTFSVNPLTLPPSGMILLSGGSNPVEIVYASGSFVAGLSTVTCPLQNPVFYAGHTTATWSKFAPQGPLGNNFLADGLGLQVMGFYDPADTSNTPYALGQVDAYNSIKTVNTKNISAVLYTTTQTAVPSWSGSGDILNCNIYSELFVNINVSAVGGTAPSGIFKLQRKDSFGNYITLGSATVTQVGTQPLDAGAGMSINRSIDNVMAVNFTNITGTTPTFTFTLDIKGK